MKHRMATMTGHNFGLSFEDASGAGGGGTAVAEAGGGAGDGGAAAGGSGGAGSGSSAGGDSTFSFFRNLPPREGAAAEKTGASGGEAKKFVVNDDAGNPIEGAAFDTEEEAKAYVAEHGKGTTADSEETKTEGTTETVETKKGTWDPEAEIPTPIYGRFKTIKETEAGIQRMEREGVRLSTEVKRLKDEAAKALATREAEVASFKAELEMARKTPAFKELTAEEYTKLDADAKVDYKFAKRDHDQSIQRTKDEAARSVIQKQQRREAAQAEIERTVLRMDADKNEYPLFREMDEEMGRFYKALGGDEGPLAGDPRSLDLLYHAALGKIHRSLVKKGEMKKTEATVDAKKTAAATATATGAGGAGKGAGTTKAKTQQEIDHENWAKGINDANPNKVLNFAE